jgi:hypothetical protein
MGICKETEVVRDTLLRGHFSVTKSTWPQLEFNSGCHSEKLAINWLSCGIALDYSCKISFMYFLSFFYPNKLALVVMLLTSFGMYSFSFIEQGIDSSGLRLLPIKVSGLCLEADQNYFLSSSIMFTSYNVFM